MLPKWRRNALLDPAPTRVDILKKTTRNIKLCIHKSNCIYKDLRIDLYRVDGIAYYETKLTIYEN
jgi:hypothetical protein